MLAAQNSAAQHDETVLPGSLTVGTDGTVHLKLERDATTLLVRRIGPIRSWASRHRQGFGQGRPDDMSGRWITSAALVLVTAVAGMATASAAAGAPGTASVAAPSFRLATPSIRLAARSRSTL